MSRSTSYCRMKLATVIAACTLSALALPVFAVEVVPTGTKIPVVLDADFDSTAAFVGQRISLRVYGDPPSSLLVGATVNGRLTKIEHSNFSSAYWIEFSEIVLRDQPPKLLTAQAVLHGGVLHLLRADNEIKVAADPHRTGCYFGVGHVLSKEEQAKMAEYYRSTILFTKKNRSIQFFRGDKLKLELCDDLRLGDENLPTATSDPHSSPVVSR